MYLKLFPANNGNHTGTFNNSEVVRIKNIFSSWKFRGSELFGPYELLNFTLLGPYSYGTYLIKNLMDLNSKFIALILTGKLI